MNIKIIGISKNNYKKLFVYLICIIILVIVVQFEPPGDLSSAGFKMLGIALISAILWTTEAVPIPVTALVIIFLQTVLGINTLADVLRYIAHPVNALLFIGFSLAAGLKKYNLDKIISYKIIKYSGAEVNKLLLRLMLVVAFLSMWMSNTATVAVMIPIAESILFTTKKEYVNIKKIFMIGIAYAGTIGGMGTPVGTTPNPITIGLLQEMADININFLDWVLIGLPFTLILIPIAWLLLIWLYPPEIKKIDIAVKNLDKYDKVENLYEIKKFLIYFFLIVFMWISGSFLPVPEDWLYIVSLGGVILLYLPLGGVLEWEEAHENVDWGVLILIGGGLSLGSGLSNTGAINWFIRLIFQYVSNLPVFIIAILIAGLTSISILFFCSITATSTTFVPIAITLAIQLDINPVFLGAAAGIASSFAYILPANTPPNAIAYSSGYFETKDMMKIGFILLVISLIVFMVIARFLWPVLFSA